MNIVARALSGLLVVLPSGGVSASGQDTPIVGDDWRLCMESAERSATRFDIPPAFMQAIVLVESGRTVDGDRVPWPWTLNVGGKGYWYPTKDDVLAHVTRLVEEGATSFDVGCAQVNYRFHGEHFGSLADMVEPRANLDYAARFVRVLKDNDPCWGDAISNYHSRQPARGARYLDAVRRAILTINPSKAVEALSSPMNQLACTDLPSTVDSSTKGPNERASDLSLRDLFALLLQRNLK